MCEKGMIYGFYWDGGEGGLTLEIGAEPDVVEKLLQEYRESDPEGYNNCDWIDFLREKGIYVRSLEPEKWIYF